MVGCRGETADCFEETYALLESLPVSQLHVFPYSERPGTQALKIPHVVDKSERAERESRLLKLSEEKTRDFYSAYRQQRAEVLLEKAPRGRAMHGFTRNYIRVELPAHEARPEYDNQIMTVVLGDFNRDNTALMARTDDR